MVLNYIWLGFFIVAFIVALCKLIFLGDTQIFATIVSGTFDSAETAFKISIGLTGMMAFWMGIMKVAEDAGAIRILSKIVAPFFSRVFPGIPKEHPASGHILMNFSANMLGLGNAATPLGLKAMNSMQELNPEKDTASNSQIMFLVLNTAGLTIIPVSVMVYRAQQGAANPSDVFIPILLATFAGTLAGFLSVAFYQRINLLDRLLLTCVVGFSLLVGTLTWFFTTLPQSRVEKISTIAGSLIIFSIIVLFLAGGLIKKLNVYETFIEGAKDGFNIAIKVIPYLVAILVGVGVFRASGAMDFLVGGIAFCIGIMGVNTDFVPALPTAFMKSLSGSGANGLMIDTMKSYGPDSFVGKLVCTMQGATDTTFYILAVYFGSVGIKKTRYALTCGLIADLFGMIAAIFICYLFFH
ncbi:MAG TPA: nucleoside recognition domain-containing protein [Bacteroidia bacterium]|jgi:spore maturation protein SpmA/spore maturation protein SpmB